MIVKDYISGNGIEIVVKRNGSLYEYLRYLDGGIQAKCSINVARASEIISENPNGEKIMRKPEFNKAGSFSWDWLFIIQVGDS